MDLRTKKDLIYASSIITLILGIIYCLTLFCFVIGIVNIICYTKLSAISKLDDEMFKEALEKREGFGWTIYLLVVSGFLGLLSFLPYVLSSPKSDN